MQSIMNMKNMKMFIKNFAEVASQEGFLKVAQDFQNIAEIEKSTW